MHGKLLLINFDEKKSLFVYSETDILLLIQRVKWLY